MSAELEFGRKLRHRLSAEGLGVLGIVEAHEPGPSDLLVYGRNIGSPLIYGWLELKVDNESLRASQVEFLRERDKETGNAFVVRWNSVAGLVTVERPATEDGWSVDRHVLHILWTTGLHNGSSWRDRLFDLRRSRR